MDSRRCRLVLSRAVVDLPGYPQGLKGLVPNCPGGHCERTVGGQMTPSLSLFRAYRSLSSVSLHKNKCQGMHKSKKQVMHKSKKQCMHKSKKQSMHKNKKQSMHKKQVLHKNKYQGMHKSQSMHKSNKQVT